VGYYVHYRQPERACRLQISASKVSRSCTTRCVLPGKCLTDSIVEKSMTVEITVSVFRRGWIGAHGIISERAFFGEYDELSLGRSLIIFDHEFGSDDTQCHLIS